MTTLLVSHPQGLQHLTPEGHMERPDRLRAIENTLSRTKFDKLMRQDAQTVDLAIAELVHGDRYLARLRDARPMEGIGMIDGDTYISAGSFDAAASGVGAGLQALDAVILGEADNAFCAIRPPGHHAEIDRPMGFCLVNNIAIVAREAQRKHGAERIAIVDFDVHHGNGTQDIFYNDPSVFYASSHEMPLFPGTGALNETGVGNICNAPLKTQSDGAAMREVYKDRIFPALHHFAPDIILVSAGFDAEQRDPLANLNWVAADFAWLTGKLMDMADKHCDNRLVSLLEGGYDLGGLADGVAAHVAMLQDGALGSV
ncbi:histone deacetylase family protein [Mariluticola halotolerans]|uniref:histone deacetylase family protein n=1 Tax=Mariluticola halotolerans TaxID=2909283 RepID=UPI0026E4250E|nr:histone deacetylase family protein [Mariluticola halotolerans]UJQ95792.1 histone deacetylase family protein [Mariluticola halotolerans]